MIVGGGMSGLVTACLLAKDGKDVVLLEKNDTCGGLVNSFTIDGFVFDGGIRAIENAGMILPMLKELEIDLPLLPSRVSVGVEDEVMHAVTEKSIDDYEQLLEHMYPQSIDDVGKVIKVIKDFNVYMKVLFGDGSPFYKDHKKNRLYYLTSFIPWVFGFLKTGRAIMKMQVPVEDFLHEIIEDQSLFDIISQHFFKNTPAFFAMSYFSLYTDYYYPKGGVGKLPEQLQQSIERWGGSVVLNSEIIQVDTETKKITDSTGREFSYDKLVWCADLKRLYTAVDEGTLNGLSLQKAREKRTRVLSARGAESVFTLFLAVDEEPAFFQKVSHGHFFYTPSKTGLGSTHREDLEKIKSGWNEDNRLEVLAWLDTFCALNTFEVSIPVLNDPDTAPQGKSGVIISFLMDYDLVLKVEKDGWYGEFSSYIEQSLITIFDSTIYPGIKDKILFTRSSSPLTIERIAGSSEGSIVGWTFENPLPIDAGMLNMKKAVLTPFDDIYKAGQWTVSPAGLPTCIMTAKMVADRIKKER